MRMKQKVFWGLITAVCALGLLPAALSGLATGSGGGCGPQMEIESTSSRLSTGAPGHARLWLGSEGLNYFKKSYALTKGSIIGADCYGERLTPPISADNEWVHACAWKTAQESADGNLAPPVTNPGAYRSALDFLQTTGDARNIESAMLALMVTYFAQNADAEAGGAYAASVYRDSAIRWINDLMATPTCVYSAYDPFDESLPEFQIYSVYTYSVDPNSVDPKPTSTYIYKSRTGAFFGSGSSPTLLVDDSGAPFDLDEDKLVPARQKSEWSRCSSFLMTLAVSYDWFHDELTTAQRKALRERILAEVIAFDKEYLFDLTDPSWIYGQATVEGDDNTIKPCRDFEGKHWNDNWANCHKDNAMFTETCSPSCSTAACLSTCSLTKPGRERLSQNSNMWQSAAMGTAALVIRDGVVADAEDEGDGTSLASLDTALSHADVMVQMLLNKNAQDGATTEGMGGYWSYGLGAVLRYLDARRTLLGDTSGFNSDWIKNSENFYQRMRHPNGQFVNFDDSVYWGNDASGIFGLLAKVSGSSSMQRLAWQGSGPWRYAQLQRPVWALLWYDLSLAAATDTAVLPTLDKTHHFEDRGLLSFRSDWQDPSAMHMVVQGGTPIGGHQHGGAGHFTLFGKKQHLVTDQGRTPVTHAFAHNTLLINGYGQHGNGADMAEAPPKDSEASSKVVSFQNGAHDAATTTLDLTGMYTYDKFKIYGTNYDAFTDTPVTEVLRSFVWLGGEAILIHDTVKASQAVKVDWKLHSRAFAPGFTDPLKRHNDSNGKAAATAEMEYYDCNVLVHSSGRYQYSDGTTQYGIELSPGEITTNDDDDGAEITASAVYRQLSSGSIVPVLDTTNSYCAADPKSASAANPIVLNAADSSEATITAGAATLLVRAYDGNAMKVLASPSGDGSTVRGYHLSRSKENSDTAEFTTWLVPSSTEDAAAPAKVVKVAETTVGKAFKVSFSDGRESLVLAGQTGSSLSTGYGSLTGHVGLIQKSSTGGGVDGIQLTHGTKLVSGGNVYLLSLDGSSFSASLQFSTLEISGSISVSQPTKIRIYVGTKRPRSVRVNGRRVAFSRVSTKSISLTASESGALRILLEDPVLDFD
jgi:hypothetical protein